MLVLERALNSASVGGGTTERRCEATGTEEGDFKEETTAAGTLTGFNASCDALEPSGFGRDVPVMSFSLAKRQIPSLWTITRN